MVALPLVVFDYYAFFFGFCDAGSQEGGVALNKQAEHVTSLAWTVADKCVPPHRILLQNVPPTFP